MCGFGVTARGFAVLVYLYYTMIQKNAIKKQPEFATKKEREAL